MRNSSVRESPSKRLRISLACNTCRKRKSKCDGDQPACRVCRASNRICSYDSNPRKRGLQNGYVRNLEALLGLVLEHYPQSEKQLKELLYVKHGSDDENDTVETAAAFWRKSSLARNMNEIVDPLLLTASNVDEPEDNFPDENNQHSDHQPNGTSITRQQELCPDPTDQNVQLLDNTAVSTDDQSQKSELPMFETFPNSAVKLVEFYFSSVHTWFPIVRQSNILKALHTFGIVSAYKEAEDYGHYLCLWAILAYSLTNSQHADPTGLARRAEVWIRTTLMTCGLTWSLGYTHALLVLTLLHLANGNLSEAYVLIAHASRRVLLFGDRKLEMENRYKLTLCGCGFLDSVLSAALNKCPCLRSEDLKFAESELNDDSLDEWKIWVPRQSTIVENLSSIAAGQPLRSFSTIHKISELNQLLNSILHSVMNHDMVIDTMKRLQTWHTELPSYLGPTETVQPIPSTLHLHLTRYTVLFAIRLRSSVSDHNLDSLVYESVRMTDKLIHKHADMVGWTDCSPLFLSYITGARRALEYTQSKRPDPKYEPEDVALSELYHRLVTEWRTVKEAQLSNASVPGSKNHGSGSKVASQSQAEDHPSLTLKPHAYVAGAHLGDHQPADGNRSSHLLATDSINEDNTISNLLTRDIITDTNNWADLDGMPFLFSAPRSDYMSTLSQNLGFLGGDVEPEWLEFFGA